MYLGGYLTLLQEREGQLAESFTILADLHAGEPDICSTSRLLAQWSRCHAETLAGLIGRRYPGPPITGNGMRIAYPKGPSGHNRGLLYDLHSVWLLGQDVHLRWTVAGQAAHVLRDAELEAISATCGRETDRQLSWLRDRIEAIAPQALVVV